MPGTPIDKLVGRIASLEKRVRAMASTPQLGHSSIENGTVNEYDEDGVLVSSTGAQHDGTHGSYVLGGPVPPTPTAPVVEPVVGGLRVAWDGLFTDADSAPMDWSRLEVHALNPVDLVVSPNAYFETDVANWSKSGGGTITRSTDVAHQSAASMKVAPDGTSTSFTVSTFNSLGAPAAQGQEFTASMWLYSPAGYGSVWVGITWINASQATVALKQSATTAIPAGQWTHLTVTGTPPATAVAAGLRLGVASIPAGAPPLLYLDDAELTTKGLPPPDMATTLRSTIETPRGADVLLALPVEEWNIAFVARSLAGKASQPSAYVAATPLDIADVIAGIGTGTTIYYGPDTPAEPAEGDLWYFESAPGQYVTRRFVDGEWIDLPSETADQALAEALAASEAAATKNQVFKATTAPTATATGDLWIDTDDGNRLYRWNGSTWESTQFGNGAIAPNSLVASNVVVVGTVTTDLLQARAVTAEKMAVGTITATSGIIANAAITNAMIADLNAGKITAGTLSAILTLSGKIATSLTGPRVEISGATGIRAFDGTLVDPNTGLAAPTFQVDTGGNVISVGESRSRNYVEGSQGYRLGTTDGSAAQIDSLNVIGDLGADAISTSAITLGTDDLRELLDSLPRGAIAFTPASVGPAANSADLGTTEAVVYEVNVGSMSAGRQYKIWCHGNIQSDNTVASYDVSMRFTNNGTTPTTSSVLMAGSVTRVSFPDTAQNLQPFACYSLLVPGVDYDTVRIAVTLKRALGAGTSQARMYGRTVDRRFELVVEDMGLDANIGGTISQKSWETVGGVTPPPEPDPKATYTKSWSATWSRSFDADNSARSPDTNDLYQGYISSTHGNTRSQVGFDSASIMAALAGATVNSIKLSYRVKHEGWGTGLDLDIGTHSNASRPSTFSNYSLDRGGHDNSREGVTYTIGLPIAVGNDFKSGAAKGITFGPGDATNIERYGYLYGQGSTYEPKLTITYTK